MIVADGVGQTFRPPVRLFERKSDVVALDNVSFTVERGTIVGLAGENGAGKSTLLRLVAGVFLPTRGRVAIDGCTDRVSWMRTVGAMLANDIQPVSPLSPREQLAFFAALHGKSRAAALARADALLQEVGLAAYARRPEGELSTGQRRRVAWARARVGEPRVLVLDEPTRGLDRASADELRAALRTASADGGTILLASHDDADLALCTRVHRLAAGRLA